MAYAVAVSVTAALTLQMHVFAQHAFDLVVNGPPPEYMQTLFTHSDGEIIAGFAGETYHSTDGKNWSPLNTTEKMQQSAVHAWGASRDSVLYAATDHGVFHSAGVGMKWRQILSTEKDGSAFPVRSLLVTKNGRLLIGRDSGIISRSLDGGESWRDVLYMDFPLLVSDLCESGNNIYATTSSLSVASFGRIYHSADEGGTWDVLHEGEPYSALIAIGDSVLLAAADLPGGGIMRSVDEGRTWSWMNLYVGVFTFAVTDGGLIFAGTRDGIYFSKDLGLNWAQYGLDDLNVRSITFDFHNVLYAAGASQVHRTTFPVGTSYESPTWDHTLLRLHQNAPNPASTSTTISFELTQSDYVSLAVFDVNGRERQLLARGIRSPGAHLIRVDLNNLESGVYFYRLQTSEGVNTQRMIVVR